MEMKALLAAALPAFALLLTAASPTPSSHASRGKALARLDFSSLASLCDAAGPPPERASLANRAWKMPELITPARAFDNLIFLGNRDVSAWAIETSEGLVLIDALNNETEAREIIEAGLLRLGRDPAAIRFIIITHGHGDHYGGAQYLAEKYGAQLVMGAEDWDQIADDTRRIDIPGFGPPPRRGLAIAGRDALTLGDTTFQLIPTPGHTEGTISVIFPVIDKGQRRLAALWGGTGFNFGPLPARYRMYAASADLMAREVRRQGVEVFLSNHAKRDLADQKLAQIAGNPAAPNPFVLPPRRTARAFEVFRECALAQIRSR